MKRWFIFFILLILILSCQQKSIKADKRIKVITTLYPLYDFSRAIGSDLVDVKLLLPPGVEPHHYEPTPKDIFSINDSDIFIYINKYMEPWAEDIAKVVGGNNTIILDSADNIRLLKYNDYHEDESEAGKFNFDPHVWLDFNNCQILADNIAGALIQKDPANKDEYSANCASFKNELFNLDKSYETALNKCRIKTLIYAGHFAFGYMARRYNLIHISPYKGFSANAEPTAANIIEMIDNIKKMNVKYLFYEELLEPKVAKTISEQTKIELLLLNAAHNITKSELDNNITFIDIMKSNLENLKKGLDYKE